MSHSFATLLLNAGASIMTVQALLGHKFLDTTLTYARPYDGTIANDYYAAMTMVERRMKLVNPPVAAVNVQDQIANLLDQLAVPELSDKMRLDFVSQLKSAISV